VGVQVFYVGFERDPRAVIRDIQGAAMDRIDRIFQDGLSSATSRFGSGFFAVTGCSIAIGSFFISVARCFAVDEMTQTLALTLGAGWASGINLYATILLLGLLGATGTVDLPPGLDLLMDPLVLLAAGFMYLVEFVTDKVPGVDTAWDSLHTFVRIPAGAMLAAGAAGDLGTGAHLAAAIMGGGLAATSHFAKAGSRVLINTSPEPFTNWAASFGEDVGVVGGLLLAVSHPLVFLILLAVFLLLLIWLAPKIWRGIGRLFRFFGRLFAGRDEGDRGAADAGQGPPG